GEPNLLHPLVRGTTGAELRFGARHEGALNISDLLERRTRVALIAEEGKAAEAAATEALTAVGGAVAHKNRGRGSAAWATAERPTPDTPCPTNTGSRKVVTVPCRCPPRPDIPPPAPSRCGSRASRLWSRAVPQKESSMPTLVSVPTLRQEEGTAL